MSLYKLINRLNTAAPSGWIKSLDSSIRDDPTIGQREVLDDTSNSVLETSNVNPVSPEDYFLDMDVKTNFRVVLRPKTLFTLNDARVIGPSGDIISSQGKLLPEFSPQNGEGDNHTTFRRKRFGKKTVITGFAFNLATPYSTNYYHWLTEALPGLRAMKTELDQVDTFILPPVSPFHLDSLNALGIKEDRIFELDNRSHLLCEKLQTMSFQRSFAPSPHAISWLQSTFSNFSSTPNRGGRRLYLSRDDAGWRNNANEDQVMTLLNRYGFESVQPSSLDFTEQVKLFGETSTLISAHGAGLTNLVFSKPGTNVLEVLPPRWTPVIYAHLCKAARHVYNYCNAQPMGLTEQQLLENKAHIPPNQSSQSGSISLPLDKIEQFCKTLD